MNETFTLKDLLKLLLKNIWVILVATAAGAVAGFGVSKLLLDEKYSSHITLYVQCYTDINDNDQNDISKSKQLLGTYIELLGQDDFVMRQISDDLVKKFDEGTLQICFEMDEDGVKPESVRDSLSLSSVVDTSAINAVATTKNAEVSAAVLQSLKDHANENVKNVIGVGAINSTAAQVPVYTLPVSPNVPRNTVLGALAGFLLTVLAVMIIGTFDNKVKDVDDLSRKYHKPILGEIDKIVSDTDGRKKNLKKKMDQKRMTLLDPNIPFNITESYKSMRTNILFSLSTSEKKVFVVSSANPGEGKSTTASNIAITLAQGNYKTLLIDGDLRKPILISHVFDKVGQESKDHKAFEDGFSTVLSKSKKWQDCVIRETGVENLHLLPAGKIPPNPSELLGSPEAERVLNELSEYYDYIIIDGSPVGPVGDCYTLSKIVAGMLFVVLYGSTTFEDIDNVLRQCKLSDMNVIGFCLNGISGNRYGTYSHYGRYGRYGKNGYYSRYGYGKTTQDGEQKSEMP